MAAAANERRRAVDHAPISELLTTLAERVGGSEEVQRREQCAYRVLCVLLAKPECSIESLLADGQIEALSKTAYRVTDAMDRARDEQG